MSASARIPGTICASSIGVRSAIRRRYVHAAPLAAANLTRSSRAAWNSVVLPPKEWPATPTAGVDGGVRGDRGERGGRVAQHRRHEQPALDEAVGHLAEMLQAVVVARVGARTGRAAVLESGGVGREDGEAAAGERGAEGLERVAGAARDLALAPVPLAVVLVVDDDAGPGRRT